MEQWTFDGPLMEVWTRRVHGFTWMHPAPQGRGRPADWASCVERAALDAGCCPPALTTASSWVTLLLTSMVRNWNSVIIARPAAGGS